MTKTAGFAEKMTTRFEDFEAHYGKMKRNIYFTLTICVAAAAIVLLAIRYTRDDSFSFSDAKDSIAKQISLTSLIAFSIATGFLILDTFMRTHNGKMVYLNVLIYALLGISILFNVMICGVDVDFEENFQYSVTALGLQILTAAMFVGWNVRQIHTRIN